MGMPEARCSRCGEPITPGVRYCARCGEVVDAALVAELHELYTTLRTLDEWVNDGKGSHTVLEIRKEVAARYLALRTPPIAPAKATATATARAEAPSPAEDAPARVEVVKLVAVGAGAAPDDAGAAPPSPVSVVAPAGPVFSWRAFIAEQAIAIMAYLGGFLLLVATLSFELGGWQVLGNELKLLAVCIVYIIFGALGFAFRRSARLGTVGRAYLAIFALMTPLVALAVYRFELQQSGFSPYGMLCLAAAYAAAVYLLLAWRSGFVPYAYLGWTALGVASLAIIPWANAPHEWAFFALALLALVLLAVAAARNLAFVAILREPALYVSGLASVAAGLGTGILGVALWSEAAGVTLQAGPHSTAAFAFAAGALVPLALLWSRVARGAGHPRQQWLDLVDWLEWLTAATVAQAAIGVAAALGANVGQMTYVLAGLALAEMGAAVAAGRIRRERTGLRYLLEALALALAVVGALTMWSEPSPNWPLAVALAAGAVVALAIALIEEQPGWLLVAGGLFSVAYHTGLLALLPAAASGYYPFDATGVMSTYFAALALVEWGIATGLMSRTRRKSSARAVYLVAVANALYATVQLPGHAPAYMTALLAIFAFAALAAGRIGDMPIPGGIVTGCFGVLAVIPYSYANPNGITVTLTALVPALTALGLRRWLGRRWAYGPYVVALWATLLADTQLLQPTISTAGWSALGIPYVAWVTFVVAALACVAAVWENDARATVVPAALALVGFATVGNAVALTVLVFALAGIGVGWHELRGRWWSVAWYGAALVASPYAIVRLGDGVPNGPSWQAAALLAYGAGAYLLALRERQPMLTVVAGAYGAAALLSVPGPDNLVPTLILTFALAAAGTVIRLGADRGWTLVFYAVASIGSVLAILRIVPYDAGTAEALLLIFAAVACLAAALEREPVAGIVPALYAGAIVVVRPDAHALLPLALLFGVVALIAGRLAGPQWAWPAYVAAAVMGVAAAALGASDSAFDAWALLALAVLAYAIAALESRADVAALALLLGGLALASCAGARGWSEWQSVLAFAALAWAYFGLQAVWRSIPWLRSRGFSWWAGGDARWEDPRTMGGRVHSWGGLALAVGTVGVAVSSPQGFTPRAGLTESAVVALLSCGAMLAAQARLERLHALWYVAGEMAALAITWQLRWLGAGNVQAYVLAPGSYQILVGALLSADERMGRPHRTSQWFSLGGSLLLLVPTLSQTFLAEPGWLYVLLLALEALLLAGIGAGTRSRLLVLTGSVFVGVAAIRGAALAVSSNVPIALVIAALALLLMGGATWLSLRARREAHESPTQ